MQTIGKFQIVSKLGEGGMGVVYKAYDPLMERHVAIKTIAREMSEDARSRDRFLREARAIARLEQHKNIVTVYDLFEQGGQIYLVMELLTGSSLEQVIKSEKRIALEEKLWILLEVLDGLAYAHDNDIIHRDVKPGNVFLSKNRGVKILDFGLAHIAASATQQTLRNVGTPCYMSPEQWRGEEADDRTDLFSLGVVAYEFLTGKRPFSGDNLAAVGLRVLNEEPPPIRELNPAFPVELSNVIARAMAKKPHERFANARDMAHELERVRREIQESAQTLLERALMRMDEMERVLDRRRELFRPGLLESVVAAVGPSPADERLLARIGGRGTPVTTNAGQSVDYLQLVDEVGQIESQLARVKEILPRLEKASSVLQLAEVEEREGNLEGALRMAAGIHEELPSWSDASDVVERIRARLEEHLSEEERRAKVEALLKRAQDLIPVEPAKAELPEPVPAAPSVDEDEERRRRIATLLAEARARMEAQSPAPIPALDVEAEPEEAFVFRKADDSGNLQKEVTLRLNQPSTTDYRTPVSFIGAFRRLPQQARHLWARILALAVATVTPRKGD